MWRLFYYSIVCFVIIMILILTLFFTSKIATVFISVVALTISLFNFYEFLKKKYTPALEAEIQKRGEFGYALEMYNSSDQLIVIDRSKTGWQVGLEIKKPHQFYCEITNSGSNVVPHVEPKGKQVMISGGLDRNNNLENFPSESKGIFIVTTKKGKTFKAKISEEFLAKISFIT